MTHDSRPPSATPPDWPTPTLIAFRFSIIYFGLYILLTQMLGALLVIPGVDIPLIDSLFPARHVIQWVGHHVLHARAAIPFAETGSGDRLFDWAEVVTLLLVAAIGSAVWTLLARRTRHHDRLHRWFRFVARLALATTLLSYGFAKLVPLQMRYPPPPILMERFGDMSPMAVLWSFIGASPAYEIFAGAAEVCAGVLLLIPRTALLGALMALMDSIAIFTLNMTYDVPVKLLSFHLVVLALILIAWNVPRLWAIFLRGEAAAIQTEPRIVRTERGRRIAAMAQGAFVVYLLAISSYGSIKGWRTSGGGAPRPPLYGIWNVNAITIDGVLHPGAFSDSTLWRSVIFTYPGVVAVQRADQTLKYFRAKLDTAARTLTMAARDTTKPGSAFKYARADATHLMLDGTLDGHPARVELSLFNTDSLLLRKRGFHWVQEYPFNR